MTQTAAARPPGALRRVTEWTVRRVTEPGFLTATLQTLKSVVAAALAWWFSVAVLASEFPFLAPWVAMLAVHATVYRSLWHGVQTFVASTLGVGLSFVIGNTWGVSVWSFALALLIGLILARIPGIRSEGVAVATTALFVLSSGFTDQEPLLLERIVEVGVGVAFGLAINLLVIPPLQDRQAARYVDSINLRMGELMVEMTDQLADSWDTEQADSWIRETESMSRQVTQAWTYVWFARESERANPRAYLSRRESDRRPARQHENQKAGYGEILSRADEGISHLRHLARTLRESTYAEGAWNERFRTEWVAIVRDAGRAIADPDADVEPVHERLDSLARELSEDHDLPESSWPTYGSLITSMRHIAVIVDDVASSRRAREAN
ncbi:MAG: FUSC family protein [Citricoccus sp.]